VLYAVGAYTLWGVFPIYWKMIQGVPALEIVGHRMVWSFLLILIVIWMMKGLSPIASSIRDWRVLGTYLVSATLLVINWLVYIGAVNSGFIVDASLGYFINPLVNVLLGVVFLKEGLRLWQWIPVGVASLGVLYLTISYGSLPWIGLVLAFTFGLYGFIRKKAQLNSLHGFTLETGFMFVPALGYLTFLEVNGGGALGHVSIFVTVLLVFTGLATALPLLMFGAAARSIQLSTLGFIQYIAPTLQFLIGVLVYGEAFSQARLIGFGLIWVALAIFSIDGVVSRRNNQRLRSNFKFGS
jgi:chloramphenicol-sensitive protein RarD